jgi:hypothetical protein
VEPEINLFVGNKENFLKYVETRNLKTAKWITKLVSEIEKRTELQIEWFPKQPRENYPVSAQIKLKNWSVVTIELLGNYVFFYFREPRFYFGGYRRNGKKPLWTFPTVLQSEIRKILENKGEIGGMIRCDSKIKFENIVKAMDFLVAYSQKNKLILSVEQE